MIYHSNVFLLPSPTHTLPLGEEVEEEKKEGPSPEQMLREFREKLLVVGATKEGSSLGVYGLLNEIKDKSKTWLF